MPPCFHCTPLANAIKQPPLHLHEPKATLLPPCTFHSAPPSKPCLAHAPPLHPSAGKGTCGHVAHIGCALQCLLDGTVEEAIMLDALSML